MKMKMKMFSPLPRLTFEKIEQQHASSLFFVKFLMFLVPCRSACTLVGCHRGASQHFQTIKYRPHICALKARHNIRNKKLYYLFNVRNNDLQLCFFCFASISLFSNAYFLHASVIITFIMRDHLSTNERMNPSK